jgi:hypothetical protein
MEDDKSPRRRKNSAKRPLVWVKSFNGRDKGRPLRNKQKIVGAIKDLSDNPSIGLVCPMIPGRAPDQIPRSADISLIGDQHGLIATTTASIPASAMEALFLVNEKMKILERADKESLGLVKEVLGVQQPEFDEIAERIRNVRNGIAHPDPFTISTRNIDLTGVPQQCRSYARRLLKWNASPYRGSTEEDPASNSKST